MLLKNKIKVDNPNYKWWVYSSVAVAILVQVGDQTGTSIAMPSMSLEFNADIPTVQWVYLLYTLCISSLLLPMGRFSDIFGRKPVYCGGLVLFIIGGIIAGISFNFTVLLLARAVQGIAVSMILANGMALLVEAFPNSQRGVALGLYITVVGMGGLLGPLVSGFLVSEFGWRSFYVVSVLVGVIGLFLSIIVVDYKSNNNFNKNKMIFDWLGAFLFSSALACFLLAMTFTHRLGWDNVFVFIGFILSLTLLACFLWREKVFNSPMIELFLFRDPVIFVGLLGRFLTFMAGSSVYFLMPFYVIQVMGLTAFTAALLMTPMPIMMALMGPLSGKLSDKIGTKWPATAGLITWGAAVLLGSTLSIHSSSFIVLICCLLSGTGNGIFQSPNQSSVMSVVNPEKYGVLTALISMVRTAGNLTGTAIATFVVVLTMSSMGQPPDLSALESSIDMINNQEIKYAFTEGITKAFKIGMVFLIIGLALTALGPNTKNR